MEPVFVVNWLILFSKVRTVLGPIFRCVGILVVEGWK